MSFISKDKNPIRAKSQIGEHVCLIMIAKVMWVLSNFIIHVSIARLLGPGLYGIFGVILSILSIGFLVLGNGLRQAIVKYVAEKPDSPGSITRTGLIMQLMLVMLILQTGLRFGQMDMKLYGIYPRLFMELDMTQQQIMKNGLQSTLLHG